MVSPQEGRQGHKEAPLRGRRVRVRAKQHSYLALNIAEAAAARNALEQTVQSLSMENQRLRSLCVKASLASSQAPQTTSSPSLQHEHTGGPWAAQRLLHAEQRAALRVHALPPPEHWTPVLEARLSSMGRDELRYMVLTLYEDNGELLKRGLLPQLEELQGKGKALWKVVLARNPAAWGCMTGCNLITGEPGVPTGWYANVAASLPLALVPPWFVTHVHRGVCVYNAVVETLSRRRATLRARLAELVAASTSKHMASPSSTTMQRAVDSLARPAPQPRLFAVPSTSAACGPAAGASASQPLCGASLDIVTIDDEDVLCATDRVLDLIEDTFAEEYRAVPQLYDYVWQEAPSYLTAYLAASCAPYHLHFPSVCAALCANVMLGHGGGDGSGSIEQAAAGAHVGSGSGVSAGCGGSFAAPAWGGAFSQAGAAQWGA